MCREIAYAPAVLLALAAVMTVPARGAPGSETATGAPPPRGDVVHAFDLGETDEAPADLFAPTPLDLVALPPAPEEKPVVVPLPPALGPGLGGLAVLAVVRVGRRVYGRR